MSWTSARPWQTSRTLSTPPAASPDLVSDLDPADSRSDTGERARVVERLDRRCASALAMLCVRRRGHKRPGADRSDPGRREQRGRQRRDRALAPEIGRGRAGGHADRHEVDPLTPASGPSCQQADCRRPRVMASRHARTTSARSSSSATSSPCLVRSVHRAAPLRLAESRAARALRALPPGTSESRRLGNNHWRS